MKLFYFPFLPVTKFGHSSCGWSQVHLPHKIEKEKTLGYNYISTPKAPTQIWKQARICKPKGSFQKAETKQPNCSSYFKKNAICKDWIYYNLEKLYCHTTLVEPRTSDKRRWKNKGRPIFKTPQLETRYWCFNQRPS